MAGNFRVLDYTCGCKAMTIYRMHGNLSIIGGVVCRFFKFQTKYSLSIVVLGIFNWSVSPINPCSVGIWGHVVRIIHGVVLKFNLLPFLRYGKSFPRRSKFQLHPEPHAKFCSRNSRTYTLQKNHVYPRPLNILHKEVSKRAQKQLKV